METAVASFTDKGHALARQVEEILRGQGHSVTGGQWGGHASPSVALSAWVKEQFGKRDALVFVGAAGIAVRAIAPYLRSKTTDPAVIVIDEQGKFCIPILSGHLGGANELAVLLADRLEARAVVTTATDLRGVWAVDVFAKKHALTISDMGKAREISARLLSGESVTVCVQPDFCRLEGAWPEGLFPYREDACEETPPDIVIGGRRIVGREGSLYLIPRSVTLGIGCKKGTTQAAIAAAVLEVLEENRIFPQSVAAAASIDLKQKEKGLRAFCEAAGIPIRFFCAGELQRVSGSFQASAFVKETTGTDNVCERSAVCACGGPLIIKKQAKEGVTVAAAGKPQRICFE